MLVKICNSNYISKKALVVTGSYFCSDSIQLSKKSFNVCRKMDWEIRKSKLKKGWYKNEFCYGIP